MSKQVPPGYTAWSKRGARVGSWPAHHAAIELTSSLSLLASAAKLSAPSEGTTTQEWICWTGTPSGGAGPNSPVPHQPALSAPGASQSAAPAAASATSL